MKTDQKHDILITYKFTAINILLKDKANVENVKSAVYRAEKIRKE